VDQINEELRVDEGLADALMGAQINIAVYHLRLEEALYGYDSKEIDMKVALDSLDKAITLVKATLDREVSDRGRITEPLTDPALRARADTIKALLVAFKVSGLERLKNPGKAGIGTALESRFETIFKEVSQKTKELEDIIETQLNRDYKKSRDVFRGILAAWTFLVAIATAGIWLREQQRKRAKDELIRVNVQLHSQTEELTAHRQQLAELVEKRTIELTTTNKQLTAEIAERTRAEETLKESEKRTEKLASWLINAQEIERKRIAMELHDELGQALNATKLHLRVIENGLGDDQPSIRNECEKLLAYMDQIIEDVRRLSLALSPTVLEDLGLTAAIHWLVSGFARNLGVNIAADIEEIDHFVPEKHRITVYRVLQEILTNIYKHAQAKNISIVIRRHNDTVAFSVEDDGRGFDPKLEFMKAPERGLGLETMSERMKMAGGFLDLRSQEGKGTRIAFSIPLAEGGV
jgi:signal transduction histidine kinase